MTLTRFPLADVLRPGPGPAGAASRGSAARPGADRGSKSIRQAIRQAGCWYASRFSYAYFAFVFTSAGGSIRGARLKQ